MLLHLIRKELLDHLLSLRFAILATLGVLIIGLSLYSGSISIATEIQREANRARTEMAEGAWQERINTVQRDFEKYREIRAESWRGEIPPWQEMTEAQKLAFTGGLRYGEPFRTADLAWQVRQRDRLRPLLIDRENRIRSQQRLAVLLASVSPLGSAKILTSDLARTGLRKQDKIEKAVREYNEYHLDYVRRKDHLHFADPHEGENPTFKDFSTFTYVDTDDVAGILQSHLFPFLNLLLLSALGYTGAFVSLVRYDVR